MLNHLRALRWEIRIWNGLQFEYEIRPPDEGLLDLDREVVVEIKSDKRKSLCIRNTDWSSKAVTGRYRGGSSATTKIKPFLVKAPITFDLGFVSGQSIS